jgi:hypothetical protein
MTPKATATPPPGTYQKTSKNVSFQPTEQGRHVLTALCQKVDGSWVESTLKYDIANCDGVLKWAPTGC